MGENELLDMVTTMACMLTKYGAEVYRAEESIRRICRAYGHPEAEIFVIPTEIIITLRRENGEPLTRTCRVTDRTVNLDRIDKYNGLSRHICHSKPRYQTIMQKIDEIETRKIYPKAMNFICNIIIGAVFAFFFGGGAFESISAAICSALIFYVSEKMDKFGSGVFMKSFFCSFAAAVSAVLLSRLGLTEGFDKVIISSFMTLVPGVAITNCMRDFIAGDLLAGIYNLTEALLIAAGMAVGAGVVIAAAVAV